MKLTACKWFGVVWAEVLAADSSVSACRQGQQRMLCSSRCVAQVCLCSRGGALPVVCDTHQARTILSKSPECMVEEYCSWAQILNFTAVCSRFTAAEQQHATVAVV
ncbi:hypothetical protein COO60DRAFT_1518757 [Scenedesmus sp. NREL 46B-D3]|nr:hypothetical protein COO60DRAFT_1518757 [Scenedesmus sp. NREL 46B-D3]